MRQCVCAWTSSDDAVLDVSLSYRPVLRVTPASSPRLPLSGLRQLGLRSTKVQVCGYCTVHPALQDCVYVCVCACRELPSVEARRVPRVCQLTWSCCCSGSRLGERRAVLPCVPSLPLSLPSLQSLASVCCCQLFDIKPRRSHPHEGAPMLCFLCLTSDEGGKPH